MPTRQEDSPHQKDMDVFNKIWNTPTDDRTIAIVCVSYIEKYLGEAIKTQLPGLNSKLRLSMFNPEGPIGSLGTRNHLAKALGLINNEDYENIKMLASIRNQFAHHMEIDSFDHKSITDRVEKLKYGANLEKYPGNGWTLDKAQEARSDFFALIPRKKFNRVATKVIITLHNYMNSIWHGHDANSLRVAMLKYNLS